MASDQVDTPGLQSLTWDTNIYSKCDNNIKTTYDKNVTIWTSEKWRLILRDKIKQKHLIVEHPFQRRTCRDGGDWDCVSDIKKMKFLYKRKKSAHSFICSLCSLLRRVERMSTEEVLLIPQMKTQKMLLGSFSSSQVEWNMTEISDSRKTEQLEEVWGQPQLHSKILTQKKVKFRF